VRGDGHGVGGVAGGLGPVAVLVAFDAEVGHLAFDDAGVGAPAAWGNRRAVISRSPSASAVARWSRDSCEAGKLMELRNAER
jgi:hypothetical protein